jgi:hypothetical protein
VPHFRVFTDIDQGLLAEASIRCGCRPRIEPASPGGPHASADTRNILAARLEDRAS